MRESKFKGFSTDKSGWVFGFLVKSEESYKFSDGFSDCHILDFLSGDFIDFSYGGGSIKVSTIAKRVFPESVGMWTGLKDKNGVEIYEGDIVVMHTEWSGGHCSDDFEEFETKGVVRIQSSKGTVITKAKKRDLIECDDKWLKTWDVNLRAYRTVVIGNIYENPELLGE